MKGYIIYEGPSQLDGEPIVGLVTLGSSNVKTGNLMQMYIMRADVRPTEATKTGEDKSVCGDCKHRHHLGGSCYVMPFTGPLPVWKSWKAGSYVKPQDFSVFDNKVIRFGAYGDPHALPLDILVAIKSRCRNNTSYTHLWQEMDPVQELVAQQFGMASVDNLEEKREANTRGWRTFRVVDNYENLEEDEIICPNITNNISCLECKLCSGTKVKARNIVVKAHGVKSKRVSLRSKPCEVK